MLARTLLGLVVVLVAGCGAATQAAVDVSPRAAVASPSQPPLPTPATGPVASPAPPAPRPASTAVRFTGLPAGTFPTHIHSVCSGSQNFHITIVPSLLIRGGSGTVVVPSGYLGRGLCLIVYTGPSLTHVLTTRRI